MRHRARAAIRLTELLLRYSQSAIHRQGEEKVGGVSKGRYRAADIENEV